mgnify:CR=1 FL=1
MKLSIFSEIDSRILIKLIRRLSSIMLKNASSPKYFLGFGFAAALMSALATPVSAQSIIIINGNSPYYRENHHPTVGNFIYGSPIATPIPVNPVTGHTPRGNRFSKPYRKRKVYNSTFINPIFVNPRIIRDSRRRYRDFRRRKRQPASRIMINSDW